MANEKKESMQMFCVEDIVKRAKLVQGFKKDSQLASYLGISRSTLSNWLARNSINFPLLLSRYSEVDYNWLLTGKGIPTRQRSLIDLGPSSGEAGHQSRAKLSEPLDNRSVTLYDISSTTDLKSLLENRSQYATGKIIIPNIPICDGAMYVSGDSMYPLLKSGDIVGFRFIQDFNDVIYGETYLVSFQRGGDEYLTVKYVNRSEQPGHIRLVSYDPHHEPMDLPLEQVNAMAIVKFSIRKNMMR